MPTYEYEKNCLCCCPSSPLHSTGPQVRTTRAGIVDYFKNFLKLSPQGKVDQSQIRMLSPNLALHSGVYSFTLEEDGKLRIVQVRGLLWHMLATLITCQGLLQSRHATMWCTVLC